MAARVLQEREAANAKLENIYTMYRKAVETDMDLLIETLESKNWWMTDEEADEMKSGWDPLQRCAFQIRFRQYYRNRVRGGGAGHGLFLFFRTIFPLLCSSDLW
jgi:hypothetical protein